MQKGSTCETIVLRFRSPWLFYDMIILVVDYIIHCLVVSRGVGAWGVGLPQGFEKCVGGGGKLRFCPSFFFLPKI